MMTRILFLALTLCAQPLAAKTLKLDKERTILISGPIGNGILAQANQVYSLALASPKPIYLVLNSPGGSVYVGLQMLSAMRAARARGVEFRCLTTLMSASMAFQILAYCDKRYALEHTLLLWHSMRGGNENLTAEDHKYEGAKTQLLEAGLIRYLIQALNISTKEFFYHRARETLWTASTLLTISPKFLVIVDDVDGLTELFPLGGE